MEVAEPPGPPGWYSDPEGLAIFRWWNGAAWTKHTADPAVPSRPDRPQRYRRIAPPGWRRWLLIGLGLTWLGTCGASMPYMDFPPGDWYSPVIVNDTAAPVTVSTCFDDRCSQFDHDGVRLEPRQRRSALQAETHGGTRFAVQDARSGQLIGCLTPSSSPDGEVDNARQLRVGEVTPCGQPVPSPAYPRWVAATVIVSVAAAAAVLLLAAANWLLTRPGRAGVQATD